MKETKKFFAVIIMICLAVSSLTGICFAADDAFEYDFIKDGWQTREGDKDYISIIDYNDGDDGKVIEVKESYTTRYVSSNTFPETVKDKTVKFSFDFMFAGKSNNNFGYMYVKDGALSPHDIGSEANFPTFTITPQFNFSCFEKGWTHSSNKIGGAKSNVWYRIDCIYDLKNKTAKHYVDGAYIGETALQNNFLTAIQLCASTMNGFDSSLSGVTGGTFYFDNIKLEEPGEKLAAWYNSSKTTDTVAAISFSEPVNPSDFENASITDCETFENVKVSSVSRIDNLTLGFEIPGLKNGAEYKLSIPAGIKGEFGNITKEAAIFFNANDKVVREEEIISPEAERFNDDFSDYTEISDSASVETTLEAADGVNRWALSPDGNTHYQIKNVNGSNALYINMSKGTAAYQDHAMARNDYPDGGTEFINSGVTDIYFDMALGNPSANDSENGKVAMWAGLPDVNGKLLHLIQFHGGGDVVFYNLSSSKWAKTINGGNDRNISTVEKYKITVNYNDKTIKVAQYDSTKDDYIQQVSMTFDPTVIGDVGFRGIEFNAVRPETSKELADGTGIYVDNVKIIERGEKNISEYKQPVVKKVRIDGAAIGNEVPVNSQNIEIFFNTPMDPSTLEQISVSTASCGKGVYNENDYSYTIPIKEDFIPLTDYTIYVPVSVSDADGNKLGREYSCTFTSSKGIFEVTDFELKEGNVTATLADTSAGDKLTAEVLIKNSAEHTGEYVLVYMVYDGNKLVALDYVTVPFSMKDETIKKAVELTVPETKGQLGVKAMLWENFETMKQAADAIELK